VAECTDCSSDNVSQGGKLAEAGKRMMALRDVVVTSISSLPFTPGVSSVFKMESKWNPLSPRGCRWTFVKFSTSGLPATSLPVGVSVHEF